MDITNLVSLKYQLVKRKAALYQQAILKKIFQEEDQKIENIYQSYQEYWYTLKEVGID